MGKYLPFKNEELALSFCPDPNIGVKKKWHQQPANHKEIREVN